MQQCTDSDDHELIELMMMTEVFQKHQHLDLHRISASLTWSLNEAKKYSTSIEYLLRVFPIVMLNLDCYPEERLLQPPMNLRKRVRKRYLPVPSPLPSPSPSPTRRPSTPLSPPVTPTSSIDTDESRYNV
ncbi:hypothetical protein OUZ56_003496 [Daphnia magna]|uniref:Uncharacterized protein n=1 Tax=Daphnia magna TaxID=35525 RepID=A0ABR0A953_9CRUS|nr:hypothetical protein OUZ56_003496 [Daphnia magna]